MFQKFHRQQSQKVTPYSVKKRVIISILVDAERKTMVTQITTLDNLGVKNKLVKTMGYKSRIPHPATETKHMLIENWKGTLIAHNSDLDKMVSEHEQIIFDIYYVI